MLFYQGEHLRVSTPVTLDGQNLAIDERGQVVYKETLLPLTARKDIEKQNEKLPPTLRKKIEVIGATRQQEKKTK